MSQTHAAKTNGVSNIVFVNVVKHMVLAVIYFEYNNKSVSNCLFAHVVSTHPLDTWFSNML